MTAAGLGARESWWARWWRSKFVLLALVPFGFGSWAAFLWAGLRAQRPRWMVYGALYLALLLVALALAQPDGLERVGAAVLLTGWGASIVHALAIRRAYLDATWSTRRRDWTEVPHVRRVLLPLAPLVAVAFALVHLAGAALELRREHAFTSAPGCAGSPRGDACRGFSPQRVVETRWGYEGRGQPDKYVVTIDVANGPATAWQVRVVDDAAADAIHDADRLRVEWYDGEPIALVAPDGRRFRTTYHPTYLWYDRLMTGIAVLAFGFALAVGLIPVLRGLSVHETRRLPTRRPLSLAILLSVGALFGHLWGAPWPLVSAAAAGTVALSLAILPRRLSARA